VAASRAGRDGDAADSKVKAPDKKRRNGDDEEDRPAKKKKKKKKSVAISPMLYAYLGGGVLVAGIVAAVALFVWPGFLREERAPRGTGQENLLSYVPANADVILGLNVVAMEKVPGGKGQVITRMRELQGSGKAPAIPRIDLMLQEAEKCCLALDTKAKHAVLVGLTRKPLELAKVRKDFGAKARKRINGKSFFVLASNQLLYMPSDRVIITCNMPEEALESVAKADDAAVGGNELVSSAQKINQNTLWAVSSLDSQKDSLDQLGGISAAAGKDQEMSDLLSALQRARTGAFWLDVGNGLKLGATLQCASDSDAAQLKEKIDKEWQKAKNLFALSSFLPQPKGAKDLDTREIVDELSKSFKASNQGPELILGLELSEKSYAQVAKSMQVAAGKGDASKTRKGRGVLSLDAAP
jgi:hypothetical protein